MSTEADCPVCLGSKRVAAPNSRNKQVIYGYDKETDTVPCCNCGGQYQWSAPSGKVRRRQDGTPCKHEYREKRLGNCYHSYTCIHCGDYYTIDSGD